LAFRADVETSVHDMRTPSAHETAIHFDIFLQLIRSCVHLAWWAPMTWKRNGEGMGGWMEGWLEEQLDVVWEELE